MNDKIKDFQQLISLTQAMLEQAESSAWDEVIETEAKRRELMGVFFSIPVQPELASTVAEGITTIMAMDRDIIKLGQTEKQGMEQVLRQMEQGKKAVKAYSF
jgi:hypothetical protein